MKIHLVNLAERLGGSLEGDGSLEITGAAGLREAGPSDISFIVSRKFLREAENTKAGVVIAEPGTPVAGRGVIRVDNAYLAFARVLEIFFPPAKVPAGIDATALVDRSAVVDPSASVGPFCRISRNAAIGPRAVLGTHCVVGSNSAVGADSLFHPRVVVNENVTIGERVIIQSGAVLGSDGFGYVFDGTGHRKIPQVGGIEIGDDVEIGANTTIDRGTIGTTRIGRGTKIDNLVQIAHNVVVGENSIIVALAGISGSTRIGSGVALGGQVGVAPHLTVGDGARIAAQSGILGDVPAGETRSGIGPIPHRKWLKAHAIFPTLPELRRRISELEEKVAELESHPTKDKT